MAQDHHLLEELVDDEDFDRLFSLVTLDDVGIAYARYHSREHPVDEDDDDPDWWSVSLFFSPGLARVRTLHRPLLLALVAHAPDDATLSVIGAGPIEDFVSDDEDDLRWLEAECAHDPKLRKALGNVWCALEVSEATLARLDAAAGVRLARPRPREDLPPEMVAALDEIDALRASVHDELSSITPESLSSGSGFPMGLLARMAELITRLAEYGERHDG